MNKTNYLILLCIIASGLTWLFANQQTLDLLAFSGDNLQKARIWTPLTSLFIHSDPTHLIGNMIFLYIFGNTIEKELNHKWVIVPFFVGGVATFLLSTPFFDPATLMIGASGAIFTITAIVMLLKPLKISFYFLMPLGLVAIVYFTYNIIAINTGQQGNISYIGHIIGFLIGLPFGVASSKNWLKNLLITLTLFAIYLLITWILLPTILNTL